jgi:3-oxoacyl-ACP reductase-like protein
MFSNLMSKIFSHAPAAAPASPKPAAAGPAATPPAPTPIPATSVPTSTPTPAAPTPAAVDVTAILNALAAKNPEKLDWKRSIVDLMKLVGIESSLTARKELAAELHYPGDTSDSATMNVWLHKAVLKKLAENGGKVPQDLLD